MGYNIVRHFVRNKDILACVRNHHERWDGRGYPDQMHGDRIPLFARIVSAADTYHAMASQRPYRKALSKQKNYSRNLKHIVIHNLILKLLIL